MDKSLEIKRIEREMVVLLVGQELLRLMQEVSHGVAASINGKPFTIPDPDEYARKIIAIVKEHSV